ncbi:RnfABCDGE type electron transport complex subunit B [Variovorax sp. RHLX14]|uniref:RnfABCDGE type electron transport complex subunit B n=1 Tax=Variovorax sp. RHLX14 TaxID=1259731 RepID=UPI003F4850CF
MLAARIHDALPQTQCTRCGYPDCKAYADAIAHEGAAINRCPPGGVEGIARLSTLTGSAVEPLDPSCGTEGPRHMAVIDEAWCIGCTLCLDACPTDAILGMNKRMHTVIEPHCTGCELCIPVCPVDCIALEDVTPGRTGWQAWSKAQADAALARYAVHARRANEPSQPVQPASPADAASKEPDPATQTEATTTDAAADRKRTIVAAALARARNARKP